MRANGKIATNWQCFGVSESRIGGIAVARISLVRGVGYPDKWIFRQLTEVPWNGDRDNFNPGSTDTGEATENHFRAPELLGPRLLINRPSPQKHSPIDPAKRRMTSCTLMNITRHSAAPGLQWMTPSVPIVEAVAGTELRGILDQPKGAITFPRPVYGRLQRCLSRSRPEPSSRHLSTYAVKSLEQQQLT
jgi:hypothetical protein